MKYNSFSELFAEAEKKDSYWSKQAALDFTSELYQLMKQRGITKKELAQKLGTSQAYITKVFKGDANFTIESMVRLTRALKGKLSLHVTPQEEKTVNWYRVLDTQKAVAHSWGYGIQVDSLVDNGHTNMEIG